MRSVLLLTFATFAIGCIFQSRPLILAQEKKMESNELDGAYEFVSEITVLTKPEKSIYKRDATNWLGQWLFKGGRFSQTLMKTNRRRFLALPKTLDALGFESSAGSYEIDGTYIVLVSDISLHPVNVGRPMSLAYHLDGDILTLKEPLRPSRESLSEGTRTTVLKRIK